NGCLSLTGSSRNKLNTVNGRGHLRSVSAPPSLPLDLSPPGPNHLSEMRKLLMSPIEQSGFVYILTTHWKSRPMVKIGIAKDVEQRLQKLSKECCSPRLGKMEVFARIEVKLRSRVEKLVHKELQAFRASPNWCNKEHREFFYVPPEVAKES